MCDVTKKISGSRFVSGETLKNRAFTLIELLSVIAVIGVLSAILIPVVGKMRTQANLSESVSQLRQIGVAFSLYAQDHNGVYPAPTTLAQQDNPDRTHWALEITRIEGLLGQATTFIHQGLIAPNPGYEDPSGGLRDVDNTYLTYSLAGTGSGINSNGFLDFATSRRQNQVEDPAQSVLAFLAKQRPANDGYCRTVHPNFGQILPDVQATSIGGTRILNFAYNGSMPTFMADGSVRALKFTERSFLTAERWEGRRR